MQKTNSLVRWLSILIVGAIIFGFMLTDGVSTMVRAFTKTSIATIDGDPINEIKFKELCNQKIISLKKVAPHITPEDFKKFGIPMELLKSFVRESVFIKELKDQGFTVSNETIRDYLKENFKHGDFSLDERFRKPFVENTRMFILTRQLYIPFDLPSEYKALLSKSFHSLRKFDLIRIQYDDISIDRKPSQKELEEIEITYKDHIIGDEKRTFDVINFVPEQIKVTEEEQNQYYNKNKNNFKIPERRDVLLIKAPDKKSAEKIISTKNFKSFTVQKLDEIETKDLPGKDGEIVFALPVEKFSSIVKFENHFQIYVTKKIYPARIPDLKEVKNIVIEQIQKQKNKEYIENIRKILDEKDLSLDEIQKQYGYSIEHFENINQAGTDTQNKLIKAPDVNNLLHEVFMLQPNQTSDIVQKQGSSPFIIRLISITPREKMKGKALEDKLKDLWLKTSKEKEGQKILENIINFESEPEKLYKYIANKKLKIAKNQSISRLTKQTQMPNELIDKILNMPVGRLAIAHTPGVILIARIIGDVPSQVTPENLAKQSHYFHQSALESVENEFMNLGIANHTIKMNPNALDDIF